MVGEDGGEATPTSVGEGEGPETEVGGSVGDGPQTVLNGVDGLVDEHLPKLKLFSFTVALLLVPNFSILSPCMHHLPLSPHHFCYLCLLSLLLCLGETHTHQLASGRRTHKLTAAFFLC